MARSSEGSIPFMRAEDLHMWLISLTLFWVLSSSLAFVSNHFGETERPWVEFAIVITRVFVFGASVLLWSLALLLNNVKADWILLFASMCVIIIPRACLPFRVGDCMMNHVCFMAFNFFTPRPTWKISAMCILSVFVMMVSDNLWGALPPLLAALKSLASLILIVASHIGYQAIRTFFKQLREAKRPTLPVFSFPSIASECGNKRRADGWKSYPIKGRSYTMLQRRHPSQERSHDIAKLLNSPPTNSGISRRIIKNGTGQIKASGYFRMNALCDGADGRRYWTSLENCGPLYCQAVHKRLSLFKDDMLRFATEIEDSGVWCRERESELYVVPRGQYGYVDCRWYLEMKFSRPLWWLCSSLNKAENGQSANAVDHPANASAPEPAVTSRISEFPTYNVSQRPDEGDISGGNVIEFCRSASFGLCPERGMKSWEGGSALSNHETSYNQGQQRNCSASAPRDSADGGEAATADKGLLSSLLIHHKGAIKELEGQGKKGSHSGASLPRPLKKAHDMHKQCSSRYEKGFPLSSRFAWIRNLPKFEALSRTTKGFKRNHGIKRIDDSRAWCCFPCARFPGSCRSSNGEESYSALGSHEEILMPKMELGIFKDDAIERWYLLWRAGHIIGFYKETASTNMFICVLQCLFGVVRACIMEYLSKLENHRINSVSGDNILEDTEDTMSSLSLETILRTFGRHVAQLGILIALVLPMKFIDGREGRNVWKFQLLGLGQAVTHVVFVFVDVYIGCYRNWSMHLEYDDGTMLTRAGVNFVIGGYLLFPLIMIALYVQLRRTTQVTILFATFGSAIATVSVLFILGWELKILLFYTLSRTLYAVLVIMIARSFETMRRELFSAQILPFLLYLSTLSNSRRVDGIFALRAKQKGVSTH